MTMLHDAVEQKWPHYSQLRPDTEPNPLLNNEYLADLIVAWVMTTSEVQIDNSWGLRPRDLTPSVLESLVEKVKTEGLMIEASELVLMRERLEFVVQEIPDHDTLRSNSQQQT